MAITVQENVVLAPFTLYKIGGPARFFIEARNSEEIEEAIRWAVRNSLPLFVLGAGSNVLVSDQGFDGAVIRVTGGSVRTDGDKVSADSGVMMARVAAESVKAGLGGFEWGIGIPGTIGGSVRGNAGCFGGDVSQVLERARVFEIPNHGSHVPEPDIKIIELSNAECGFGYRDSIFKRHPEWVVLSATLKLSKSGQAAAHDNMQHLMRERTKKQDIGTQSCGCMFKNIPWSRLNLQKEDFIAQFPELIAVKHDLNIPTSLLIDRAGLKGMSAGAIEISKKHANFFINKGGGTAYDVIALATAAKKAVYEKYGLEVEEEIVKVGKF